jgi:hypothetical protein
MRRPRVLQAEEDHPRGRLARERGQVTEVEVERQDNPILREGLGEYLLVGRPVQPSSRRCTASCP